jgi:SdrD B-like domain
MPLGTSVTFSNPDDPSISFSMSPNSDGTYVIELPTTGFTPYIVNVTTNQNYIVTQSNEIGLFSNIGANPTRILGVSPDTNYDAGKDGLYQIPTTGTITGKIYPDLNNNGFQDTSEPDYNGTDNIIPNGIYIAFTNPLYPDEEPYTTPNTNGTYSQTVRPGITNVRIIPYSGYAVSTSTEPGSGVGGNPTQIEIAIGETKSAGKDGLFQVPKSYIAGKLYADLNGNGIQDSTEPDYSVTNPIPAYINLITNSIPSGYVGYYPSGNVQQDGTFVMELPPNDYELIMRVGSGVSITQSDALNNVIKKGLSSVFTTVNDNQTVQLGKFGIYSEPDYLENIYSGYVYEDFNNNGIKDAGEKGIEGVKLTIEGEYSDGLFYFTDSNGKYNIPYFFSENPLTIKEFQPGEYDDGIDSLGLYANSTIDDQIFFQYGYFGFSVNNNFGERPKTTQTQAGGGVIIINQDNQKPIVKVVDSAKLAIQLPTSKVELKATSTLAIDRKFDLNDPYVCGGFVYGNVISNPNIIADINIEFTQTGKIAKVYNFKTNANGTWKQVLDDLPYGKYSYKVVARYEELKDTESLEIEHKSLEQCADKIAVQSENIEIQSISNTVRTGSLYNYSIPVIMIVVFLGLVSLPIGKKNV